MITLFKDPFTDVFEKVFETSHSGVSSPQIKVSKNESDYKLLMSIPGLTKDDLKITIKDGILSISFESNEKTDKSYFVSNFKRLYTLPEDVREKDIEGSVENGILKLIMPIREKRSSERMVSLN